MNGTAFVVVILELDYISKQWGQSYGETAFVSYGVKHWQNIKSVLKKHAVGKWKTQNIVERFLNEIVIYPLRMS